MQYQGGLSTRYKNFITENNIPDATYSKDGLALFRVQGSGPENMQAIQVEPVTFLSSKFLHEKTPKPLTSNTSNYFLVIYKEHASHVMANKRLV